jgi:hypothetical protein
LTYIWLTDSIAFKTEIQAQSKPTGDGSLNLRELTILLAYKSIASKTEVEAKRAEKSSVQSSNY